MHHNFYKERHPFYEGNRRFNLSPLDVHFITKSMTKKISMKNIADILLVMVIYDSQKERAMMVHYNECLYKLKEYTGGLYYYDNAAVGNDTLNSENCIEAYSF